MKKGLLAGMMLGLAVMSACSGTEEEPLPANVMSSNAGVTVELEWTTGGTSSDATRYADLELYLMKGTSEIDVSAAFSSFESVSLSDAYADAEYLVQVEAYRVEKNTSYTLYVKGDNEGEIKSYTGVFNSGDSDIKVDFLKIKKAGSTYTIAEL
ncbi:hypothetical protein [Cesiribacter sp. SM1]|uniref:hypothetical protein n=1 Tax=Cesiribacter sp. SM1 TaxID=2861196 RepID=UPI001CD794F3|nr:hypothetical protein [Cesiribacter sp. SM1]